MKLKPIPIKLKSTRFCLTCEEWKTFKYDPVMKHSLCESCGKHYASHNPTVEWYENHIKELEEITKKAKTKYYTEQIRKLKLINKILRKKLDKQEKKHTEKFIYKLGIK